MEASEEKSLQDDVMSLFERPIERTAFYKDLPRLLPRLSVELPSGEVVGPFEEGSILARAQHLFSLVAAELVEETKEREGVEEEAVLYVQEHEQEQDTLLSLPGLVAIYGTASRTIRALKLIHQNLILHCMFELKTKVLQDITTKDVREREGWLVHLRITDNVQLTHTRREQGVDPTQPFTLTWTVTITFDRAIEAIGSASVRVTHLEFGEDITPEKREELRRKLIGDIILA